MQSRSPGAQSREEIKGIAQALLTFPASVGSAPRLLGLSSDSKHLVCSLDAILG